ncbi:MAG TPA: YigZ family protein [Candidatus Enterenecus stercoripullorum]|nr:YigZ family protein [Candidatus Enterenecus stercoripullorum]
MTEYYIPTASAEAELVEKRSRFIGQIQPVETEEQARAFLEAVKKKHYDARHNCWCYLLKDGAVRYSDDGEPQGTAGQPMLGVFQKEGVTNLCCVVTRYFGGILLGAGGLVRAYTQAAKLALDAAGTSVVRRWVEVAVDCPYSFFERVKAEAAAQGGVPGEIIYAAQVTVQVLLPEERAADFGARMVELSAGACRAVELGEVFKPVQIK